MSDIGRPGGVRVLAHFAGLLMEAGPREPSNSGVVSFTGASTPGCKTVGSTSIMEYKGPAPGLAVTERNQGRSLTEGPPSMWCPPAQPFWPAGPCDSWPTFPVEGAAPTPAEPWPG